MKSQRSQDPFDPLPLFTRSATSAAAQQYAVGEPRVKAVGWRWKQSSDGRPNGSVVFFVNAPRHKNDPPLPAKIPRKLVLSEFMRDPGNPYGIETVDARFEFIESICPLASNSGNNQKTLPAFLQAGQPVFRIVGSSQGTLCALARKNNDPVIYLLSAQHVFDDKIAPHNDAVGQQLGASGPLTKIGELFQTHINEDIALAKVTHSPMTPVAGIRGMMLPVGAPVLSSSLVRGNQVFKSGSASNVTSGVIDTVSVTFVSENGSLVADTFRFTINPNKTGGSATPIHPFAMDGDSGAIVVVQLNGVLHPVGLLTHRLRIGFRGGNPVYRYWAEDMTDILKKLQITLAI